MSSIAPISLGLDLASLGRSADPVSRPARSQVEPVVQPPAVILPRAAAWLNIPVAADLTGADPSGSGQSGFDPSGQSAADSAAQPSLVASLNAQSAVANAASATAASQSAAQDAQPAGFGSVVQLV